jgi:hypothetical protein
LGRPAPRNPRGHHRSRKRFGDFKAVSALRWRCADTEFCSARSNGSPLSGLPERKRASALQAAGKRIAGRRFKLRSQDLEKFGL